MWMLGNKLKIKKISLLSFLVLFPFFLWCFTNAGLSTYIYPSVTIKIATLFVSLFSSIILMIGGKYLKFNMNLTLREILAILSCLILLFNNQNFAHNNYSVEIAYFILTFVTIVFSRFDRWMDLYIKIITVGGGIFAFFTIACYLSPSFYESVIFPLFYTGGYNDLLINYQRGYIAGLTNHVSSNGCYLALLIGVCGCTIIANNRKSSKWFILFVLTIFSLLMTGKRAHVIFSIAALFVVYWIFNSDKVKSRWIIVLGIQLIGIVVFFIAVQFVPQLENFILKFSETAAEGDVTKGRLNQIAIALGLFVQSPIWGIGWDAYKYFFENLTGVFLNVHNVYIQVLCESGIIGALVYYSFFAVNIVHCVKVLKLISVNKKGVYDQRIFNRLAYSCYLQVFFLLYCFTGNPLYDAQIVFPYMFCCAISEYYYRQMKSIVKRGDA